MSSHDDRGDRYGGSRYDRDDRSGRYDRNDRYDRDARYDRDRSDRNARPRSRSPQRDARPASDVRERKEKEPSRRDQPEERSPRPRRDYDRPDDPRYGPPGNGGPGRGGYQGRVGFAGRGAYQNAGRGGYGGGGYRREDYQRDRPLDRAAIEEGRRRREEERAKGIVLEDPSVQKLKQEQGEVEAAPEDATKDGEEEEDPMAAMMGFGGFGTTKGKGIGQVEEDTAKVHKQRTWRQYMNRRGGFNRPLEKMK